MQTDGITKRRRLGGASNTAMQWRQGLDYPAPAKDENYFPSPVNASVRLLKF